MKKSLIALAALAATASFAQSSVTISGLVDAGYRVQNAPAVNKDTQGVAANGSATTVLTIAGSEDLGGGMKANFQFQLTPDFLSGNGVSGVGQGNGTNNTVPTTSGANNGGSQQAFVGLEGGFGDVKLGRINTGSLAAWGVGSVFGTALGSGYSTNGNTYTVYSGTAATVYQSAPTRFNNAVAYTTPSFSGFKAGLLVVPKVDKVGGTSADGSNVNNRQGVTEISGSYANGPLNVAAASQKIKEGANDVNYELTNMGKNLGANTTITLNTVAANYTLGAATVYGAYWTLKGTGATELTDKFDHAGYNLGAKYVMGATTLMASYGKVNSKLSGNVDKKIYGLGADYALSKRTALYARYENKDANTNSGTDDSTNGSTKTTMVGVRHTF